MKTLQKTYLALLVCWVLVAYSAFGVFFSHGCLLIHKTCGSLDLIDFVNTYNASLLSKSCLTQKVAIYNPQVQAESQQNITAPYKPKLPFYLQYPPWFFALVLPLALLNVYTAWFVWNILSAILILLCIGWLTSDCQFSKLEKTLVFASVMASYPTWLSFAMGQFSLINLTAITTFLFLIEKRSFFAAGLTSTIVAIKLQYVIIIAIIGIVIGGISYAAGLASGLLILLVYSAAILGISNILAYPQALLMGETDNKLSGVWPSSMQNIRGYLTLVAKQNNNWIYNLSAAAFILFAAAIALIWRKFKTVIDQDTVVFVLDDKTEITLSSKPFFKYLCTLAIPVMLISSLHTHMYDYVLMVIPCIWLWYLTSAIPKDRYVVLLRMLIALFPLLSWGFAIWRIPLNAVFIQPFLLWAVLIMLLVLKIGHKLHRSIDVTAIKPNQ